MSTINQAKTLTNLFLGSNQPVFWWGPPGAGKSDGIRQLTEDWGGNLIDFRAILRDSVDMRGVPMPDMKTKTTIWLPPSELPNEKRDGKKGILFLDELNAANQQVQAACYGLVLDRKLADYHLPPGWRIVAAGNRQSDRSAAQRMPRALANRFAHIDIDVTAESWINDYAMEHCHEMMVAFIRFRPELIHKMDVSDERMFPTPRAWAGVSKICEAPENILYQAVRSLVGNDAATEFVGFVKTWRDLPDIDDILANPKKVHVPDEPSAQYAISTALGRYATRKNFEAALTYAGRVGREFEIIVGLDATKRDPDLVTTAAYRDFTLRNKDIQIGEYEQAA